MTAEANTADSRATEKQSAFAHLSESAQAVGAVAGTAAGLIAFVYFLGGTLMWLRFYTAGLPPDEAVATMSRQALLTVGLRVIVLPALVAGGLAMALVAFTQASRRDGVAKRLAPRPTKHRFWQVAIAVVVLLALVLPFSVGGLAWLTLALVIVYWWRGFGLEFRAPADVSRVRLAVVVIAVAAIISLGRQFDEPVQLLEVQVELADTKPVEAVEGVLVSADKDTVFIGDREDGTIRALRRDELSRVVLGPPIEYAPNASILSQVVGGGRWSITPVGLWCDGVRYGWLRLGDRCEGSPVVELKPGQKVFYVVPDPRSGEAGGVIPVWVHCPVESPHNCDGYARLTTVSEYGPDALGALARPRSLPLPPLREDAAEFSVEPDRTWPAQVPVRLVDWTTLATKAALGDRDGLLQPVRMKITLSADPRGKSVYTEAVHDVYFLKPPAAKPVARDE